MKSYAIVALLAVAGAANAQVSYSGGTYTQNFDSLATTGTANAWSNNATIPGWNLFAQPAPGTAITTYRADDGAGNSGSFYSYGSTGSSDRALGGLGSGGAYFGAPVSGAVAGWIAFAATNNTAAALTSVTIGFNGEQWRSGGNTNAQTMVLEYGFGATFAAVGTWTAPGGLFDWSSPVIGATAGASNGNVGGLVAGRGGAIATNWAVGDTLWVRWIEVNDVGNDHGLSIDNFSLSAVPTPGAAVLMGVAGLAGLRRRRA